MSETLWFENLWPWTVWKLSVKIIVVGHWQEVLDLGYLRLWNAIVSHCSMEPTDSVKMFWCSNSPPHSLFLTAWSYLHAACSLLNCKCFSNHLHFPPCFYWMLVGVTSSSQLDPKRKQLSVDIGFMYLLGESNLLWNKAVIFCGEKLKHKLSPEFISEAVVSNLIHSGEGLRHWVLINIISL
jgi:hypothetical protein